MGRIHIFVQNTFYSSRSLLRILANVTLKKNLVVFCFVLFLVFFVCFEGGLVWFLPKMKTYLAGGQFIHSGICYMTA